MQLLKQVARRSGAVAARLTSQQAMQLLKRVLRRSDAGAAGPTSQQTMMQLSMATSSRLMTSLGSWRP